MTEVAGLEYVVLVIEEKPHAIGCVIALGLDFIVSEESDLGINVAQERDQLVAHGAGQLAVMALLKLHRIGEPSQRIAKCADRKLDQHLAAGSGIFVDKHVLGLLQDLEADADVISFGAVDPPGLDLSLKQNVAGIHITQAHPPWMLTLRQRHSAAVI